MLELECIDANGRPVTYRVNRVLVKDALTHTNLAFGIGLNWGQFVFSHQGCPDFKAVLDTYRIRDTSVVQVYGKDDLPPLSIDT